jgi:hypothetical protein
MAKALLPPPPGLSSVTMDVVAERTSGIRVVLARIMLVRIVKNTT